MDLNRALSAHQIALIRATSARQRERRVHLREVADNLADHIAHVQVSYGAPCAHLLPAELLRSASQAAASVEQPVSA